MQVVVVASDCYGPQTYADTAAGRARAERDYADRVAGFRADGFSVTEERGTWFDGSTSRNARCVKMRDPRDAGAGFIHYRVTLDTCHVHD